MSEWKSCKDEMPDDDITVLTYEAACDVVYVGFHDGSDWRDLCNTLMPNPTHWMHLPDPPEMEKLRAVADKDWKTCPTCKSDVVAAVKNGIDVLGHSSDLMLCCDCRKLYIVLPEGVQTPPYEIAIEIDDELRERSKEMLNAYTVTQKIIESLMASK